MVRNKGMLAVLLVFFMVSVSFVPLATTVAGEIDSDGDGYSDKYERLVGTDPEDPNDYPGKDDPKDPPPVVVVYEYDVLPSERIIASGDTVSAAVYVRKDGELLNGEDVHFMVYLKTGIRLDRVHQNEDTLVDGRASFQFTPSVVGIYYLTASIDPAKAAMSSTITTTTLVRKEIDGQCGFSLIAAYQGLLTTIRSDFKHLLPGMRAMSTIILYELNTDGVAKDVIEGHLNGIDPFAAIELYRPVQGTAYVKASGPNQFFEEKEIPCGLNGGIWELELPGAGTYTFTSAAYEGYGGSIDTDTVRVYDPADRLIFMRNRFQLFDEAMLFVKSRMVDPKIPRGTFNLLMIEVGGRINVLLDKYPEWALPVDGKIHYNLLYVKGYKAMELKHGSMAYSGSGFTTYYFDIPGTYNLIVTEEAVSFPEDAFSYDGHYKGAALYKQTIDVVTDHTLTTFPNKKLYFTGEEVRLTTVYMAGTEVVRDIPVAVYLDGSFLCTASVEEGEFVIKHDLGQLKKGYHLVETFPLMSENSQAVLEAFGMSYLRTPWTGRATFHVEGIGVYLDIPRDVVRGMPVSFRIIALDSPMHPCVGCEYTVTLSNYQISKWVATGVTDKHGSAFIEFDYPDIYSEKLTVTVTKDNDTVTVVRNLEPRAETIQGIAVTNKPIYKAGETVMTRFLVWNADALEPASGELDVKVDDPLGRQILREKVEIDDHGSAEMKIPVGIDKMNGDYRIQAWISDHQSPVVDRTFMVEEYRTPVVEVVFENDFDMVDELSVGVTVPFKVQYVFGKGVTEGTVNWEAGFIPEGTRSRTYIVKDQVDVMGEWPMEAVFDLIDRQNPGDTVYVKVEFTDRFGHEAEGETQLLVTESSLKPVISVDLDKDGYEPGDQVVITVNISKERKSLGETTDEPMSGEPILLKVQTPDNEFHTFDITVATDGIWTGTLLQLGIDTDDHFETPEEADFRIEAIHSPTLISDKEKAVFRTVDHIMTLDRKEYNAGDDAVIYMAIRDLVAQEFMDGIYSVEVKRKGDNENILFTSVGELEESSVSLVWAIPETLATDTYVVYAWIDEVALIEEIRIDDPTPTELSIKATKDIFEPGDRLEFRVDFAKPFTGHLYIDYIIEGRLEGTCLRFINPTSEAVVAVKANDWRSPIKAVAYFINSIGEVVSSDTIVDRADLGLDVLVETNKAEYEPGDMMTLSIKVSEKDGSNVPGALLSLAVIDASIFDIATEFDDGAWMSGFETPETMDRGYGIITSWKSSEFVSFGNFDEAAPFYGFSANTLHQDWDNDGLSNYDEFMMGLSPLLEDTDGDGMLDGYEHFHMLDPSHPADGLADNDGDSMINGWEALHGLDPFRSTDAEQDPDGDGLISLDEFLLDVDPNDWDSDGDGMPDGWEDEWGLDPADPVDAEEDMDGDGYTNLEEFWMETLPSRPLDYSVTEWTDTDGGGVPDMWEATYGFNPFDPADDMADTDNDGWTNFDEYYFGTDPTNPNTDGDMYERDGTDPNPLWNDDPFQEGEGSGGGSGGGNGGGGNSGGGEGGGDGSGGDGYDGQGTGSGGGTGVGDDGVDWGGDGLTGLGDDLDSDGDGLLDKEELSLGTNPFNPDTDGDGLPDALDKDPLNFDAPVIPEDPDRDDVPEINPFIPHKADSKIIDSFHQRKWFTDTAYWAPDLSLETGAMRVSVLLPDNIGKWRIKTSAWTDDLRSGESIIEVNSYKGLFVESVVPDNVFQDDEVTFKARIYNFDGVDKKVTVVLTADDWLRAWGENERPVTIGAREVKEVPFFVKIDGMHEQKLRFGVSDGTNTDAVEAKTFIEPNGAIKTTHFAGNAGNETVLDIEYFPEYIPGSKNAILSLSAGYEGLFMHGAYALGQYPYDCTEQTMSKLLINALVWRYHKAKGTLVGLLKEEIKNDIYENLNRLYTLQHEDGGWGWWETDTSDAWMTSYALFGISMVKEQGFNVDHNSISGAQFFLVQLGKSFEQEPQIYWQGTSWLMKKHLTMTATVTYALVASGYKSVEEALNYLKPRFRDGLMDAYTATLYGLTLEEIGHDTTEVEQYLMDKIELDGHWKAGNSLGGGVETTGWATYFLVKTGTEPKDLRPTLTWLSSKRCGGSWSTTSDSIANLFAVTEVMFHAKQPSADVMIYVNGELVEEFRDLNAGNFREFNAKFKAFDITEHMATDRINEVRVVKQGEGDLFYELTNEQYLRAGVKVGFQAAAQGRVGDLIKLWMEVKPDRMENVEMLDLTVAVPQASGLVLLNTRKVDLLPDSEEGSVRYLHTFAAREKGWYTLAPIVISYQLTAGEEPSGVIRDYFGPVEVLVKVPLSELTKRPGLKEDDLGDLINGTRDNLKDKVDDLRDDIKDRINETKDKVKDKLDDVDDKKDELKDDLPDIKDEVDLEKRTGGRSLDIAEEAKIEIDVDTTEEEEKVTVVDFVPLELEIVSISDGGTYEDGQITWDVEPGAESSLSYKVKANEEFSGELGRAVALKPESVLGVSNVARMVFTTKNFMVVRDSQESAYAGELSKVVLNIMTTGEGLWYAAIEDYAPAGATIDEDSVANNIDDNVLAYHISGTRVTFFVRKAENLTIDYSYIPSLVGTTVAPPAKAYPMYDTANSASSNSEVISVDYPPEEIEGGGGGGKIVPDIKPLEPPELTIDENDIVLGDTVLREKRLTTVTAYVHNEGGTDGQATITIHDYDVKAQETRLIGHRMATIKAGSTEAVTANWRPSAGDHRIMVEVDGGGGGARVQTSVHVTVEEGQAETLWAETITPENIAQGPCLLVIMILVLLAVAGVAHNVGKRKAVQEVKRVKRKVRKREK